MQQRLVFVYGLVCLPTFQLRITKRGPPTSIQMRIEFVPALVRQPISSQQHVIFVSGLVRQSVQPGICAMTGLSVYLNTKSLQQTVFDRYRYRYRI